MNQLHKYKTFSFLTRCTNGMPSCTTIRESTLSQLNQGAGTQQFSLCELRLLLKRSNLPLCRYPLVIYIKITEKRIKRAMPFLSSFCGSSRFVKTHRSYPLDLPFRRKTKPGHDKAHTEENSNEEHF